MQQWQQVAQQAQQQGLPPPPQPQPPAILTVQPPTEEMIEALEEPSWDDVMGLLRNEKLRGFVVDVETDSTIEPDQKAQQQSASEFVGAVAQFMTAALPIMQASPDAVDFLGELMAWTTRQWKGADTIEGAVDEFVEKMKKKAEQPPPPNPQMQADQMKAEAEVKKADASVTVANMGVEKAKIDLAASAQDHQQKMEQMAMQATTMPAEERGEVA